MMKHELHAMQRAVAKPSSLDPISVYRVNASELDLVSGEESAHAGGILVGIKIVGAVVAGSGG